MGLPEIKLAMLPGAGGTQRLPRAIGKAKAMDMCLSARLLDATEADRYGLVSRVVPAQALMAQTLALASTIARLESRTNLRITGCPVEAVAFQSMSETSSPNW